MADARDDGADAPPGWNYRKHKWIRYGARGRQIIVERIAGLIEHSTPHWFRRLEAGEREVFILQLINELERMSALDCFTPAIEEEARQEAEAKMIGRGRWKRQSRDDKEGAG